MCGPPITLVYAFKSGGALSILVTAHPVAVNRLPDCVTREFPSITTGAHTAKNVDQ